MVIVQLDSRVPAGLLASHLEQRGISFRTVRLFEAEELPPLEECRAVAVLGGYMGVHDTEAYPFLQPLMQFMREAAFGSVPLLGICLGGQLLAAALGGEVNSRSRGEKGMLRLDLTPEGRKDPLFSGLPESFPVFQWHNDSFDIPSGAFHLASSSICSGQAFRRGRAYGLQFHPEVDEAIVTSWVRDAGEDPGHLQRFAAGSEGFLRTATLLFDNFLALSRP